ncbi:DUF1934 domain-containing protein [Streptococcus suis]|nr:DUF1934 domain-containing protein [Streptococcus suis]
MRIYLHNEIDLDGQTEVVEQQFDVEVMEKGHYLYLMYINDEQEKVIIKCNDTELVMTRFSNPKTIMRFVPDKEAIVTIPTPVGIQHFVTVTKYYKFNRQRKLLHVQYELRGMENQQRFAAYKMDISWG